MNKSQEVTNVSIERDRELIRRFKEGDRQAFTEIVSRYQKRVFKLAYGFFQDKDDAMEIVQETFMRVYEKIDRFDNESSFKNWVLRVAYNLCIDFYRKFKSKKSYHREVYEFSQAQNPTDVEPEQQIDQQDFRQNLQESLAFLSARQKMIFVLKHYNCLKYQEIANILDISVGTVKSLHHRAAKALKKKLAHYGVTG